MSDVFPENLRQAQEMLDLIDSSIIDGEMLTPQLLERVDYHLRRRIFETGARVTYRGACTSADGRSLRILCGDDEPYGYIEYSIPGRDRFGVVDPRLKEPA